MIFCKHCGKQVKCHSLVDMDVYMWQHLKEKHPKQFKEQLEKDLDELFKDNFNSDVPESDIAERLKFTQ